MAVLIESIYDAVLHPDRWPGVLAALADELGANNISIGAHDSQTDSIDMLTLPIDPEFERSYATYWAQRNFLWQRTASLSVGELFCFETVMPREQFRKTVFYNEWWRPQQMDVAIGTNLLVEGSLSVVATAYRPKSAPDFDAADQARFTALLPHLQRAMQLRARLNRTDPGISGARAILDAIDKPALIVDSECRILLANEAGEQLIQLDAHGWISRNRLTAPRRDEADALARIVFDMLEKGAAGGRIAIHREAGTPVLLLAVPLNRSQRMHDRPVGMIIVDDPQLAAARSIDLEMLSSAFGLTRAEASLARGLLKGQRLRDVAVASKVSITTARTHLSHIFEKTGTRSQSDLIALLIRAGLHS